MRHRPAAIFALLWPAALTAALGAAEQAIVLDRPERVGGLATISASCRSQQHRSVQFDERKPQAENIDFMVDFAGEREVLAVSAQGQAVRLRLTVARLIRTVAGNPPLVMLPAGTQLVADYTGGHSVFRDGEAKELLAPIQQALRLALDLGDSTPLQDAAFGSAQRRSPGEQWAIRPVPAARLLADLRIIVDPATLSGTAAFGELVPGPEREQQRITATLAFSSFTVPTLSADLTVTSSAGTLALDRLYPSDPALALTSEKLLLKESLAAQGKTQLNGHERQMAITMELEQNNEFHLTPHDPVPH